jgi:hypothetical protein
MPARAIREIRGRKCEKEGNQVTIVSFCIIRIAFERFEELLLVILNVESILYLLIL